MSLGVVPVVDGKIAVVILRRHSIPRNYSYLASEFNSFISQFYPLNFNLSLTVKTVQKFVNDI